MLRSYIRNEGPVASSRMVTRSPVFFGWFVMLAGSLGLIMTSPGQTYGVSIFIEVRAAANWQASSGPWFLRQ